MSTLIVHDTPIKSGHHLNILNSIFAAYKEKYEIVNVVPNMPDKELKKIKPPTWLAETERVLDAAKKHKKILCCGTIATACAFSLDKSVAVTKVRGRGMMIGKKYAVCTYQPSTVVKDADFFRDLVTDVNKLLTHDAPIEMPDIEIQLIEKKADLKHLKDLNGASWLGMDIETTGFGIHAYPLSVGLAALTGDNSGYVIVVPEKYIGDELLRFFKAYEGYAVFHNLKFDIQHLMRKFGVFTFKHPADTMLLNYSLDERPFNRYRSHSLKLLARIYYDAPDYDVDMGAWLEEYLREEPDPAEVEAFLEGWIWKYPEKSRKLWREANPDAEWRGLKVGRDIPIEEVMPLIPLPIGLRPVPSKERIREMLEELYTYQGMDAYYTARLFEDLRRKQEEEVNG
jgi:hypothetical protein